MHCRLFFAKAFAFLLTVRRRAWGGTEVTENGRRVVIMRRSTEETHRERQEGGDNACSHLPRSFPNKRPRGGGLFGF